MTYDTIKNHLETEAWRVEEYGSGYPATEKQINYLASLIFNSDSHYLDEVPMNSGLSKRGASNLIGAFLND